MSRNRRYPSSVVVVLAALLPQCSSAPHPAAATAPPPAPAASPVEVEVAVDTSPVPRPDNAVLTLRVASALGGARRLGELLGMQQFAEEAVRSALPDILNDEGAAHVVDFEGPIDLVVATRPDDVEGIAAFTVRSLATARQALTDGHTLEAIGNPSLRMQRVRRTGARGGDELILAPIPGSEAGRLLMVHRREGYETFVDAFAPYLTRTLAAQPLGANDGALTVELHPQAIESALHGDIDRFVTEMVDRLAPGPDPNNPQFADAARAWLRDAFGAARSSLREARGVRLALHLRDSGASLAFEGAVQNPTAQFAQAGIAALRDAAPPMDLYERLPPGGWSYSAWSMHPEPLRATLNLAANAAARMVTPHTHLLEADATALRTALGALVAQDRVAVASTHARDPQDRYTATALVRVSTPSPQFVANVRALVNTLRRPGVARAMRADIHVDPMAWTLPPTTGLPAGSLLVRGTMPPLADILVPPHVSMPGGHPTGGPPHPPVTVPAHPVLSELLLVPEGDHVWVVLSGAARAQYAEAISNHPPPPPIEGATEAGTSSVAVFFPHILEEAARGDASMLRMLRDSLAHGGAATSVGSVARLHLTQNDGITRLAADLLVPRAVLGLVGSTVQRGLGHP